MKLIYGSTAAKFWFPDFRKVNDLDIISREHYWIDSFEYLKKNKHPVYVDPDFLFTIKVSHAQYDINFDKTLHDIEFFKSKNCKLDYEFYKLLIKDWDIIHRSKKISFNMTNEEFFNSYVKRKFDHDYLHEIFKLTDVPGYVKILVSKDKPLCSEEKFNKLSFEDKINCAVEEMTVLAVERYIIHENCPIKHSKYKALKVLITRLSKGWFNLFLILNFKEILFYNDVNFKQKLERLTNE